MAEHSILLEGLLDRFAGQTGPLNPADPASAIEVTGPEAQHAIRVKRLELGHRVRLLDGRGLAATARIAATGKVRGEWALTAAIERIDQFAPERPRLVVLASAAKGERLERMVDQLGQLGAAAYAPLDTALTVVEPRQGKLDRLERIAIETAKQCGRAWVMEIGESVSLAKALERAKQRNAALIIADGAGGPYQATGAAEIVLLIGPEGGFTPEEIVQAERAGAVRASFGPHILRIETAAAAGAAVILDAERRQQA